MPWRFARSAVKVLHLMRAQDFKSRGGQEVEFEGLTSKIGQMVLFRVHKPSPRLHICSIRHRRDLHTNTPSP